MKHIFVHGGPGLNSNPELHLLSASFIKEAAPIVFWNEPSKLRPQGSSFKDQDAFQHMLEELRKFIIAESEDGPVVILAHSFGAFAINDLLPAIGDRVERLVLLAPVLDLRNLDGNILDIAVKECSQRNLHAEASEFENYKANLDDEFTDERFEGLAKALAIEDVLGSYWRNKDMAQVYSSYLIAEHMIDFDSFKAVRKSVKKNDSRNQFNGRVSIVYGNIDPVTKLEQDLPKLKLLYPASEVAISSCSGHYPHLEDEDFARIARLF